MEIADLFVVNKSDRPEADLFVKNLRSMLAPAFQKNQAIPIVKTEATNGTGILTLWEHIQTLLSAQHTNEKKSWLLAERAWQLIQSKRMKDISKAALKERIEKAQQKNNFNLYRFVSEL